MKAAPRARHRLFAVALLLGACAGGRIPATHYYMLRPPGGAAEDGTVAERDGGLVVGVDSFAVDPPYDQDRLVYRRRADSAEVGFYAYHRWAAPLGRLVSAALADGLRGTTGIGDIEPTTSARDYGARLRGRVLRVEEIGTAEGPEIQVAVRLILETPSGEALWADTLSASAPARATSASEVMDAVQVAFGDLVTQARRAIQTALD